MYHCKNCFQKYTEEFINNNRVNTADKINVFQCERCFYVDGIIYGLYQECQMCNDNKTSVFFDKYGHSFCNKCSKKMTNKNCCFCKNKNNKLLNVKNKNYEYYFDNVDPSLKNYFKILYCQIVDTIGKKRNNKLYDLCVEYYKFLQLLHLNDNNNNINKLSPSCFIDKIWHEHLLDNKNYTEVCNLICGYTLYYYPENDYKKNIKGYTERFNQTISLYEKTFMNDMEKWIWEPIYNEPNEIQLFIKTLTGITITIYAPYNSTIQMVKNIIEKKEGISVKDQRLIFAGRQLENDKTLKDYGINEHFTIHLVTRLRGD